MKKLEWLMAVLLLATCTPSDAPANRGTAQLETPREAHHSTAPHAVTTRGDTITLEVARTDAQRARGLMFRESLPQGHGMLFVFPESDLHGFWMKNTFIHLDMLWLERDGTIADIITNVPPCRSDPCPTYAPEAPGVWVVELAAGEVARLGLSEGQRLELRNIDGAPNG